MRTFSHFDSNMATMARHQVAATIVGCISVYCDVVEVQAYGLDTLAKIAKFRPVIDKKVWITFLWSHDLSLQNHMGQSDQSWLGKLYG